MGKAITKDKLPVVLAKHECILDEGSQPGLAARRRIDVLVAEEDGLVRAASTHFLTREFLPFVLLIVTVYAEVHIVARTFYLQCLVQIGSRLDVMPHAFALAKLSVDERVAQVRTGRRRGEEVVEQLMANLHGRGEQS